MTEINRLLLVMKQLGDKYSALGEEELVEGRGEVFKDYLVVCSQLARLWKGKTP